VNRVLYINTISVKYSHYCNKHWLISWASPIECSIL